LKEILKRTQGILKDEEFDPKAKERRKVRTCSFEKEKKHGEFLIPILL